ncbi:MAG: hypothetical protein N4A47_04080 [Clostridia bacterium]|jgi:sugar-specific transcriptional regulator TrmB|nr:hypothetical protein [Clostridia bacterium]
MFSFDGRSKLLKKGKKETKKLAKECLECAEKETKITLNVKQKFIKNFIFYPYYRHKIKVGVMEKIKDGINTNKIVNEEDLLSQIVKSKSKVMERTNYFNVFFAVDIVEDAITNKLEEEYTAFTNKDKVRIRTEAMTLVNAYNTSEEINDNYIGRVVEEIGNGKHLDNIAKKRFDRSKICKVDYRPLDIDDIKLRAKNIQTDEKREIEHD